MEKILYIDCFSGISGDMMIGAMIDIGISPDHIRNELKKLDISGYEITNRKVKAGPISAQKFDVKVIGEQPHRSYGDIKNIIIAVPITAILQEILKYYLFEKNKIVS